MTTVASIIEGAFRESNLVGENNSPSPRQANEAVTRLNSIVEAVVGYGAGQEVKDLHIGGQYDQTPCEYVPENARLVLHLTAAKTLRLHPAPYDGQRLAVIDAKASLAANNLTLDGYGNMIEGAATLVLSTNGAARQWLYRADLANWARITGLGSADEMPFPGEFDDYFTIKLAMRINPRFGSQLKGESLAQLQDMEAKLEARYRRPRPTQDGGPPASLGRGRYSSNTAFNRGRGW